MMLKSRNNLRILISLMAVLSLMVLGASAAQAEVGANWMLSGSKITSSLLPSLAVKEVEAGGLTLLTKIAGIKVEVSCTAIQTVGIKLETEGRLTTGGQARFTGCLTKLNEKNNSQCEPSNEGKEPGAILSKAGKGLLVLNESKGIIRLEPREGETLAAIETGEECAIGQKIPIIGKLTLKDSVISTEAETHLIIEGPLTEIWAVSKTVEHKATVDGSAVVRLAEAHAELQWSGTFEAVVPGWRTNGGSVNSILKPSVQIKEIENKEASLLTKILGIQTKILCATAESIGFQLLTESKTSEGKVKFANCATFLSGSSTASAPCLPKTAGVNDIIETNALIGSLTLAGGVAEVLVKAAAGGPLVTVTSTEECAVGEKIKVEGELFLKDNEGKMGEELVTRLMVGDNTSGTVKAAGQAATVDGSATLALSGVHSGLKWSGIPE